MAKFKPQIHEVQLEIGDEKETYFIREPSGREILNQAGKKNKDKDPIDNARDLFDRYVVHEDGSKFSKEEVDELLDMSLVAMHKLSQLVQDKIGLKTVTETAQ